MNNIEKANFVSALQTALEQIYAEEMKSYEEERKRIEMEEQLKYQKYRESLKPISKDEFMKRLEKLIARYKDILKTRIKLNILFISNDIDFKQIVAQATKAKDGVDLAEIIDMTEKHIHDIETVLKCVNETLIDFDEIAKRRDEIIKKNNLKRKIHNEIEQEKKER